MAASPADPAVGSDPAAPPRTEPAEPVRFELDARAERAGGRLRLTAAGVAAVGGSWLLALQPGLVAQIVAILGLLAALGWVAAWRRARRRVNDAASWYLALDGQGLHMALGGEPTFVPWQDVIAVDVDEERLEVAVHRRGQAVLAIPPIWRGVGIYELKDAIERHRPGQPEPEGG